jgi:hypothetical protein
VVLLTDNAPGHFEAFEEGNIRVLFFPPNCTSNHVIKGISQLKKKTNQASAPKGCDDV